MVLIVVIDLDRVWDRKLELAYPKGESDILET